MDHVNRQGTDQALDEAARVLKPGGDFLLMVIAREKWAKFTFGLLLSHAGPHGAAWWATRDQRPLLIRGVVAYLRLL
jgi:ubiquinone/menaquinone biosynthesis C-methylase UbiE